MSGARTSGFADRRGRPGVGGAVIALSEPRAEYTETAVKASAMLAVLGAQFPEHAPAPG